MHRMLPVNAKTTKINEKTVSVDQMLGGENEETAVGVKPGGGAFQSVCIYNIEELVKVNGFPEHFIESSPLPKGPVSYGVHTVSLFWSYYYPPKRKYKTAPFACASPHLDTSKL